MTSISGVSFGEAWARRYDLAGQLGVIPVLGRADLLVNKLAAGRPKDLADVALLGESSEEE